MHSLDSIDKNKDNALTTKNISSLEDMREYNDELRSIYIYKKLNIVHCTEEEKILVEKICDDYSYQFFVEGDMLGATDIIKHHIKLIPGSKVVNIRQYRMPQQLKKVLENIINDFERQGIIEKCQSVYNSPVVLVSKKDDLGNKSDYRLVVDYRKLNENTEFQNFPIPLIDDILDGLSGSKFFTTLDIKGAFYQIILDKKSRDYTAFSANNFKYRWVRMPMGLATAPLTWQRTINTIFANLIGKGLYVYLDDLIIYGKTRVEHDEVLFQAMNLLKEHNMQLKISKSVFYARKFEYLGHVITENGIKANPKKIEAIENYPRPINVKKVQSFLGLCTYFRRYVQNFAKIAKPLSTLLKKDTPFIWAPLQQESFDKLKKALAEEVVLAFPDFEQVFYVTTDASDVAIGAMLSQGELPNDRPIYFFSRTLSETQKRYSTTHKELLAIVEAVKTFRHYLYGRFFIPTKHYVFFSI